MRLVPQVDIYRGETAVISTTDVKYAKKDIRKKTAKVSTRREIFHGETAEVTKNDARYATKPRGNRELRYFGKSRK